MPGYKGFVLSDRYSEINTQIDPVKALNPRMKPKRRQPLAARGLFESYPSSLSWALEIEFTMIKEMVPKIPNM